MALALTGSLATCGPRAAPSLAVVDCSASGLEQAQLSVESGSRTHQFIVEVARTPEQQAQGLMNRQSLERVCGMIFPFQTERVASFWMKNTLIPLDLIFIRADGTITNIEANTVPLSEEPVVSFEPVMAVLEISGGRSAELGIKPGDKVKWGNQR